MSQIRTIHLEITSLILLGLLLLQFSAQADNVCCRFPTLEAPTASYLESPRKFASARTGGRLHAACDLYQSRAGLPVAAVEDGKVIRQPYAFYEGTYAIEIKHASGFVARYGEVNGRRAEGIRNGALVKKGRVVGYVGKVNSGCCEPMLHFERYKGNRTGALTQKNAKPFQRRKDLVDPTSSLQAWQKLTFPDTKPLPILLPPLIGLPHAQRPQPRENQSFDILLNALAKFSQGDRPSQLYSFLLQNHFRPRLTVDENTETGRMTLVQSRSQRFSAHNFHTQYFLGEDGVDFVQHMSFVLRPGVRSLTSVSRSLTNVIPLLGPPLKTTTDFIQWDLGNGYVVWMKELSESDLTDDPLHAYAVEDIGSIKIAVELDPEF